MRIELDSSKKSKSRSMSVDNRSNSSDDVSRVEVHATDAKQFSLTVYTSDGKKKAKHYFKTATSEEMKLWVKSINKFTQNIREETIESGSFVEQRPAKQTFTVSSK